MSGKSFKWPNFVYIAEIMSVIRFRNNESPAQGIITISYLIILGVDKHTIKQVYHVYSRAAQNLFFFGKVMLAG